jgi:hypothetical protein
MNIFSPKAPPRTSHAVDCGNGHFFCWECLSEAHAPSGKEQILFFYFILICLRKPDHERKNVFI